jgi:hypothetical protein
MPNIRGKYFYGDYCTGSVLSFAPVNSGPTSFVLADKLAFCRFSYLGPAEDKSKPGVWKATWGHKGWPYAIRVDMAPIDPNPSRLQPISITAPIYMHRSAELKYAD